MAEITLTNRAEIEGTYGNPGSEITFSSNDVTTTIVQGLTVTKTADKTYWVDGALTYTIVVKNESGSTLTNGSLTDTLDTALVSFNSTYGVQMDGSATSDFTYNSGVLKVNLKELADQASTTITFQVNRVS